MAIFFITQINEIISKEIWKQEKDSTIAVFAFGKKDIATEAQKHRRGLYFFRASVAKNIIHANHLH
jgi:hypothetical protein